MCYFKGPGTVYVQSRNEQAIRQWMQPNGAAAKNKQGMLQTVFGAFVSIILVLAFLLLAVYVDNDN